MKLAIADPPYLGRAQRWYGGGRGQGGAGVQTGRNGRKPPQHPGADQWDRPENHTALLAELAHNYDGWAMACAADSLPVILPAAPADATVGVWHRTNAIPGGSRILGSWEPVIFYIPINRRNRSQGMSTRDVLTAPVRQQGFLGSKPPEWTRWVLAVLGYDPGLDDLTDLYPGSGAVTNAAVGMLLLPDLDPEPGRGVVVPLRPPSNGAVRQIQQTKV